MNKIFLPFWVVFCGITISLSVLFYGEIFLELGLIFALIALFGFVLIFEIIRKHKDFNLIGDKIIIRQMFRSEKELTLSYIKSWKENDFHFRDQVNRKLILRMENGENIDLSDKDNLEEFERLFHFLRVNKSKIREQKSAVNIENF